jgi:hypothetical protein
MKRKQCEAIYETRQAAGQKLSSPPGERCLANGEPHQCGKTMCWLHRVKFENGRLVRFYEPIEQLGGAICL